MVDYRRSKTLVHMEDHQCFSLINAYGMYLLSEVTWLYLTKIYRKKKISELISFVPKPENKHF